MLPNLVLGNKVITPYMICTLIGIFAAGSFALKQTKKKYENEYLTILLWSSIGVVIGGQLLYTVTNLPFIVYCIRQNANLAMLLQAFGGSVFYGGMFGGLLVGKIYCSIRHTDILPYLDVTALFIPLFHVFGRIGCFLSGCCYGIECEFGFVYRYSLIEAACGVRRLPVQLFEAAGNLLIFFILYRLQKSGRMKDRLLYLYFLLYSVLRFVTEFFRGDEYRGFFLMFSTSQWISLLLFCISGTILLRDRRKS